MSEHVGPPAPVDLSVRIYNWLLAAYPAPFRAEYGPHMVQVFRDACRRDYRRGGLPAMTWLWARTSLDLIRTTVEEHIERGLDMNREKFVRWSGWALMAGGILFSAGLILGSFDTTWEDPIGGVDAFYEISQIVGIVLGQILFVVGLIGLRTGFASRSGGIGAALLIVSLVGSVISLGGMLFMSISEIAWSAWLLGLTTMTLALAGYGVVAIRRRVFTRWNFAPLLAGIVIPALVGISAAIESNGGSMGEWTFPIGVSTTAIGLILLGFRMQADAAQVSATV
ncbi:MAG TPA: hypothetical protein VLL77_08040 [Anaerolineales bacterium]|nr:hypothetical protein [Anaerolineales bacterium]